MPYRSPLNHDEGDINTGTRVCRKCLYRKNMSEFHWANNRKHRSRTCKSCAYARQSDLQSRKNPADRRKSARDYGLRGKYGIDIDTWSNLMSAQDDKCAICDQQIGINTAHTDHCHTTGNVRGLLCFNCNIGLGKFRDSPYILSSAINYLLKSPLEISYMSPLDKTTTTKRLRSEAAKRQHSSEKGLLNLAHRGRGEENPFAKLSW